jgi:hypothetical protein
LFCKALDADFVEDLRAAANGGSRAWRCALQATDRRGAGRRITPTGRIYATTDRETPSIDGENCLLNYLTSGNRRRACAELLTPHSIPSIHRTGTLRISYDLPR